MPGCSIRRAPPQPRPAAAPGGRVQQVGHRRLRVGHAGDAGALVREQEFGDLTALPLLAHQVAARHAQVGEEDLIQVVLAVDRDDGAHLDAGAAHLDQQAGDALLLLAGAGRAHQAEHVRGPVRVGGPDLRAVDDVVVAVGHRGGGQARQVGAGAGLGIALAPPVLAAADARQVLRLLRFGAEGDQHRAQHDHAHRQANRRVGGGAL